MRLLFVCLGNICRSPTAEAVMRGVVERAGLEDEIEIDSAGTGSWHVGHPPDERATSAARARGVTISGSARQVTPEDFRRFDLLLAADEDNVTALRRIAPDAQAADRIALLRSFDPAAGPDDLAVPDPYYAGPQGFEHVLDLVESACEGLLTQLQDEGRVSSR